MPAGNVAKNLEGKVDENGVLIEDGYAYIQERIDSIKIAIYRNRKKLLCSNGSN